MRILVLGAGATGGYFGGRMLEAGCDVTFLVRPGRAAMLAETGLVVESAMGDIRMPAPVVETGDVGSDWDVVLLTCKAYGLHDAIAAIRPAIGPHTVILPVLNGLAHLDTLDAAFGADRVLGGLCAIAATLTPQGVVRHLNKVHQLTFGHRSEDQRAVCARLLSAIEGAKCGMRRSDAIIFEMWEKWVLLATLAACTCLMRASVGDIAAAPGGEAFIDAMLGEVNAIASANGNAARPKTLEWIRAMLTDPGSTLSASMLRDLEGGGPIEADHIVGDLLRRGESQGLPAPLLRTAHLHLKAFEARRDREAPSA